MNDFKARAELAQHTCTGMHTWRIGSVHCCLARSASVVQHDSVDTCQPIWWCEVVVGFDCV